MIFRSFIYFCNSFNLCILNLINVLTTNMTDKRQTNDGYSRQCALRTAPVTYLLLITYQYAM